jgi:8-oxo-dGTP pyrophosphatase MutT (NUDIX family)
LFEKTILNFRIFFNQPHFPVQISNQAHSLQSHGGLWEFPGGKVEFGESDASALQRELLEELSVAVDVGKFVAMGCDNKVCFRCIALTTG